MAKVLVIGASRGIGLETVKAALRAGHSVRAWHVRRQAYPSRMRVWIRCPATRSIATRSGTHSKVSTWLYRRSALTSPRAIFERTTLFSVSTRILVDAMQAAGVKRLVAVTGLGAGDSRGHGGLLYDAFLFPLLLKCVYGDKDVQERIIKSSELDWTIMRPGLLTDRPATGRYQVLTAPKDWRFGVISRADVADFLVQQVDNRALIGTTPLLIS